MINENNPILSPGSDTAPNLTPDHEPTIALHLNVAPPPSNPEVQTEAPVSEAPASPQPHVPHPTPQAGPSPDHEAIASASLIPASITNSPALLGNQTELQKLKSEVPDIGVLGRTEQLSDDQYLRLLSCEEVMAMANKSWFDAGRALTNIRDEELWRGSYVGFEEYCAGRWHLGRSKAYYLIGSASVYNTLRTVPGLREPEFESQLRSLVRLDPEKRVEAWKRAAGRAGQRRITRAMVQAAAKALQGPVGPEDKQAGKRREHADRRRQVRELMSQLLEFILSRRPYEELVEKAAALDSQVRFFFPPPRNR